MSRPAGHRNILFLKRGAPLRMIDRDKDRRDNSAAESVEVDGGERLHAVGAEIGDRAAHLRRRAAGRLNWPNARFDCLLEMYQGCRGSYEAWRAPDKEKRGGTQVDEKGHFAQDALAIGQRLRIRLLQRPRLHAQ